MSFAVVVVLTGLMLAAWCLCFARRRTSEMLVYAAFAAAAQIVLTQLWLGVFGWLAADTVAATNLLISLGVLAAGSWQQRREPSNQPWQGPIQQVGAVLSPAMVALGALTIVALAWLLVAAWLLPPRGIDDISYHLPPLYRAVQGGRLELLPMQVREGFALPLNADLLFLWPFVLTKVDRFIDLPQIAAAVYSTVVLYALARRLGVRRSDAPVIALSFLFVPVTLGQAGSNYIDVIVAAIHFTLIYTVVRFYRSGELHHLLLAGCVTGFGIGAKYTLVPLVVILQPLIVAALAVHRRQWMLRYVLYAASTLPFWCWWYWRNARVFGEPMYPFRITWRGLEGAPGSRMQTTLEHSGPTAIAEFLDNPVSALLYPLRDPGFGSLHGGFGIVFWGLGVPAMAYCAWRAVLAARRRDWLPALIAAQVLLTFALYIVSVNRDGMQWDQRYILGVTGFGLCALGVLLARLRRELPVAVAVMRATCVGAAALSLVHLGTYGLPHYRIGPAVADRSTGTYTSDYRYYQQAPGILGHFAFAWDPLDYLTRGGRGLAVYAALPYPAFMLTAGFGSEAQNRMLNLQTGEPAEPDAVVFAERQPDLPMHFVGPRLMPAEVRASGRFELVTQTELVHFWLRSELLDDPSLQRRLADYYAKAFSADVAWLRPIVKSLPPDTPIITASPLGPALKGLSLTGELHSAVQLVRPGDERSEAIRRGLQRVITVDRPLAGFAARRLAGPGPVVFIENVAR